MIDRMVYLYLQFNLLDANTSEILEFNLKVKDGLMMNEEAPGNSRRKINCF